MLAQQAAPAPAKSVTELKISVIEGQGGKNNITTKTGVPIAVQVLDPAGKPVPGADVLFQLPASGPGGAFSEWVLTCSARTNEQGRAAASGFVPNDQEGSFKVSITASLNGGAAKAEVEQSNFKDKVKTADVSNGKSNWKKWALVVAGVAAVIGIVAATR
jgi:hypothetical protein